MKEMVGGCCVCSDERGWPENPLVYCDGGNCNVAVHQACYGIVTVPTGPWYCRKCESQERSARVRCELCPSRAGALKKTNTSGWAHVVCALYIPEVRFGNVTTMEPINLDSIPMERYGKTCYICQELNKGSKAQMGACMQCNKTGCRQQFHVTCAQQLGLLCEEAGNYLDNVKYCGYCQHHYSKLKKGGNVKLIPPYKPITYETGSSDGPSSPEKESEATGSSGPSGSHHLGASSSLNDGPAAAAASSSSSMLGNISTGNTSGLNTVAMSKGSSSSAGSNSTGSSASQMIANSTTTPSNVTQPSGSSASSSSTTAPAASSAASSSSTSKNRKSSSVSKGSASSSSTSSGSQQGHGGPGQSSSSTSSSSSGLGTSGGSSNGSSKSYGSGGSGSTGGSSSKEYKEKHGKGTSKAPNSKDRDTYKDKSSKSASSSSSSSTSSSTSALSSSKNKESSGGGGHHHQSHSSDGQMKMDHGRLEKSSGGGGGGGSSSGSSSSKGLSNSSILAPSVLQQASAKEATNKYPYAEGNHVDTSGGGGGTPDAAGGAFVNESKLTATSSSTATAAPVVSTKKRKASDSSKLHSASVIDEKMPMKDVSVTLIPLRTSAHLEKADGGDSKKVKSERGSPLQSGPNSSNELNHHLASLPNHSPVGAAIATGPSSNLLATQTGATSISITKQPPTQPTTTNVIIKPPIIKDIGGHLSLSSAAAGGSASVTSGNGTTSLVVSVPLSPVNVPGGGNLGVSSSSSSSVGGGGASSASQNLFQQAIQNRGEHLNFSNTGRSSTSSQSNSQAALMRLSPIVSAGGGGGHMGADHHGGMHHRQSPLIQSSSLGMDNGGRGSLSPSVGGNVVHQSDSGMLKVTYEKQSVHGNIVSAGRLAALQDDAMSSSRRSSADSGIFHSSSSSAVVVAKGIFNSTTAKRTSRDYGIVTSSSGSSGSNNSAGEKNDKGPSSNLFANATFKAAPVVATTVASLSPAPFSSFVTSSRTPDFNSFGGAGNSNSSSGGLKISYEPQAALSVTTSNTALLTPSPSPSMSQMSGHSTSIASNMIGAQPMMKDSPPSSPNSEAGSSARKRSRKQQQQQQQHQESVNISAAALQGKVFQNGIHASHMLGNQLNPNSSVAQKMSDQLHMELEAHSVYTSETNVNLVGPMFPGKQQSSASSSASAANKAGGSGQSSQGPPSLSSMLSGGSTASGGAPQSLEQLLERQWEQGSQFLMEQAQHFDIASLLSCLHQLRAENVRLEDHVNNLVARRDHLLAVNARLAIPLNQATSGSGTFNATTNGPMEGQQQHQQQQPMNVIQRGAGESSSSSSGRLGGSGGGGGGGRGMGHGSYAMENGIDFRSAAQPPQSMMMGSASHQSGPGSGSGHPSGIVRNQSTAPSGPGGGVVVTASSANNGGCSVASTMPMGGNGAVRVSVNSSSTNNSIHQLINTSIGGGGPGVGGAAGIQSNGSLLSGAVATSLMGSNPSGMVSALGIMSGVPSRQIPNAPTGLTYPTNFQQFRRDDAQMKPS